MGVGDLWIGFEHWEEWAWMGWRVEGQGVGEGGGGWGRRMEGWVKGGGGI